MKDLEITKGDYFPTAYEWHNKYTGHCYVDYMAHPGQDNDDGYTGTPLYYFPSELLKQRDELLKEKDRLIMRLHEAITTIRAIEAVNNAAKAEER